jgi:predicted O-methyltransferase YrrM
LIELMSIVASIRPARALEIGTLRGGTLFLLCRLAAASARIISVDLPEGRYGGGYTAAKIPLYRRFAGEGQSLHFLRQDSHKQETADRVKELLGGALLDYFFIDGDHTYEGIKRDFELYSPLVRNGGVVAFHDIAVSGPAPCRGVEQLWNEVRGRHPHQEIVPEPEADGRRYGIGLLWM